MNFAVKSVRTSLTELWKSPASIAKSKKQGIIKGKEKKMYSLNTTFFMLDF